jgi:nitrite reductase/ring-hydroxylating ferredoxin subunit
LFDFTDWAQEVEDVSTLPEFQNASIIIFTPAHGGKYNIDTGTVTGGVAAEKLYDGHARIIGLRSRNQNDEAFNPTALKAVRVQVNRAGISGRVPNNAKAFFTNGGRNPQLEDYLFNVNSDFNSSQVAAYTFEMTVDLDATNSDRPFQ